MTRCLAIAAALVAHPASADAARDVDGSPRGITTLPRATADRPDDQAGPQVHFLYVVPRDGGDRELDTQGTVAASVSSFQAWLRRETGGRGLRVDTYQGELDVTFFRLAADDAVVAARGVDVWRQLHEELFAAGFNTPTKVYAIYYDGSATHSCGAGAPQHAFAAMYLRGIPAGAGPCPDPVRGGLTPGYIEFGMLHEIVHSLGFVQPCAPNGRGFFDWHVSDSRFDLMWGGAGLWGYQFPDQMRLDVNHDDYYGHGRSDCPDLANSPYLGPVEMRELRVASVGGGTGTVTIKAANASDVAACPPSCTASFARGTVVTLTAVASKYATFTGWVGCAPADPFGKTCTVRLESAASVTARFQKKQYSLAITVRGPGRVVCKARCGRLVEHGQTITLRAVPRRGARFVGWEGACRGRGSCRVVVTGPTRVRATFR